MPAPLNSMNPPKILFIMTDQQRFVTIAALGHGHARTPNLDRLAARGVACTNAYSSCPVCVPARYTLMTGCEPSKTSWLSNWAPGDNVPARCGPYLAETLAARGYRTWGLGKFHTEPRHEPLGFQTHEYSEELWPTEEEFLRDDYVAWLCRRDPSFNHLEQVHGERTDMYYVPQTRAVPAALTVESWVATRAVEELSRPDPRPQFGFMSFVTPHPPIAPPIPYNRLLNPDDMPNPVLGDPAIDTADDYLGWMNHAVWAEDISNAQARQLRARYAGSITFIDECIGKILDAVEARPDAANTLICFFSDHGDHMGDHGAWQKESFFEASCRVPFLVSWPAQLPAAAPARDSLVGMFGTPGTSQFKCMIRRGDWKYLWLANGGRELLFNLQLDPAESRSFLTAEPALVTAFRRETADLLAVREVTRPAVLDGGLRSFPSAPFPRVRIKQFARGVTDFGQGPSAS